MKDFLTNIQYTKAYDFQNHTEEQGYFDQDGKYFTSQTLNIYDHQIDEKSYL